MKNNPAQGKPEERLSAEKDFLPADVPHRPSSGIYFWWCGIIALQSTAVLLFNLRIHHKIPGIPAFTALQMQKIIPAAALLAVLAVFLYYRFQVFRRRPFGKSAAFVWCTCLMLPDLAGFLSSFTPYDIESIYEKYHPLTGNQFAAVDYAFDWQAVVVNTLLVIFLLSAALAATGTLLHKKRFLIAGFLSAPLGLLFAAACYFMIWPFRPIEFLVNYAGSVFEILCLAWVGLTLRFGRPISTQCSVPSGQTLSPGPVPAARISSPPLCGIYFWWAGIIAAAQITLCFLNFYLENILSGYLFFASFLKKTVLPADAVLAAALVLLLYHTGGFRRSPSGKGAADVWFLCLVLPYIGNFITSSFYSVGSYSFGAGGYRIFYDFPGVPSDWRAFIFNDFLICMMLSAAFLSSYPFYRKKRFFAAGCLIPPVFFALFYGIYGSGPFLPRNALNLFENSAAAAAEIISLVFMGFTLKSGRRRNTAAVSPSGTPREDRP